MKRSEYSNKLKWNVLDLYKNEEEFKKDFKDLENRLNDFEKYKNHIMDNANTLYEILNLDTEFSKKIEQVYIYSHIQNDQDTTDVKYQTMYKKSFRLYEEYNEKTSFIVPEILKSDYELVEKYLDSFKSLREYERVLKEIFKMKNHILDEKSEELISRFSSILGFSDEAFSYLTDADMKFGNIKNEEGKLEELNEKSYRKFIESSNRKVRRDAFLKLLNTYGNFKNTYASILSNEVSKNNKMANIRGFNSAIEASLFKNDIPVNVYKNLIKTVKKNIKPLSDFWKIKKNSLNLKRMNLFDASAPMGNYIPKKYTEEEAKNVIIESLKSLGNDYITNLTKAFDESWIDYVPNDGKRNGAYCTACYNVHPYVLLSFDGSLNNVSTLTHELGHAMHYYYAMNYQSYQDYGYSIFVAEVASQVNQILLSKYLINQTNDIEEKKYLIDDLIRDFKSTIYRQTMFADFELQIHEMEQRKEVLTHEVLSDLYYKLNKEYFGKNIFVDKEIKYEWARIPHFYMNFYVYQYATAYAASIKIAMDILNNKKNAKENYIEFLKLGATKTPIESLKIAGVDMSKESEIKEAFVYFADLVESLKNLEVK